MWISTVCLPVTLSLLQENTLSLPPQYGVLFGARQQIRVSPSHVGCGHYALKASVLWGLGVRETMGSSFSRPAEGLFRWNLRTETTKNFKHGRRGTTNLSKPENSTELYLYSLDMWYFMAYGHHTLSVEHTLYFLSLYCVLVCLSVLP